MAPGPFDVPHLCWPHHATPFARPPALPIPPWRFQETLQWPSGCPFHLLGHYCKDLGRPGPRQWPGSLERGFSRAQETFSDRMVATCFDDNPCCGSFRGSTRLGAVLAKLDPPFNDQDRRKDFYFTLCFATCPCQMQASEVETVGLIRLVFGHTVFVYGLQTARDRLCGSRVAWARRFGGRGCHTKTPKFWRRPT